MNNSSSQVTKKLGAAIKDYRKNLGLTQTQLADLAGVSLNYVSQLENGKPKTQLDKLLAVIDVLGLELALTPGGSGFRTSENIVEK
ncbi:MAG TPA: helix-turn-helix transcriptional regulator [Candidatus Rifleibacterium sp.]|nr:helix-turn-helix transcriptional regulator [Candidatus Rifleibacterium sp.]HPT45854.1 helix-turn-helix transcriptional regulator [Candidatus Rifleibacterium sp.]